MVEKLFKFSFIETLDETQKSRYSNEDHYKSDNKEELEGEFFD